MFKRLWSFSIAISVLYAPAPAATTIPIGDKIRSEVAEIVASINAKDIEKATKYDAADLISMESGRAPSTGAKADHEVEAAGCPTLYRHV